MEVNESNSKLVRALRLFAISWAILWIGLGIIHYIWVKAYGPAPLSGIWLYITILFIPSVLMSVIAIPEVFVLVILARLKIKTSQQWRKASTENSMQRSNPE